MEARRRKKKEGRHRVVVLLWLGVVIMAVFLMVMWHNGAVRSRGKMEKDKVVWRRRRSGGNVVHGEAVIRDNDDDVFGDHDNGNRRRDRRDAIVVFYEPGARDTSSTTDERTMTESEGDEETQSARDVKGRFMCVFEAAARALVSVDSDGAALASTTAMNVGREVIVYADDISLVEESLEKLRHSLHSYTYMSGDNEEIRLYDFPVYYDWIDFVRVESTQSETVRSTLFDATPLAWLVNDASWHLLPIPVKSMAVRIAHLWARGGVAVAYDSILTNFKLGDRTDNIVDEMERLASSLSSSNAPPENLGALSWFDERQVILGDALMVFRPRHDFVWASMLEFEKVLGRGKEPASFGRLLLTTTWQTSRSASELTVLPYKSFHITNDYSLNNVFNGIDTSRHTGIEVDHQRNSEFMGTLCSTCSTASAGTENTVGDSTNRMDPAQRPAHQNNVFVFNFHDSYNSKRRVEEFSLMAHAMSMACISTAAMYERNDEMNTSRK